MVLCVAGPTERNCLGEFSAGVYCAYVGGSGHPLGGAMARLSSRHVRYHPHEQSLLLAQSKIRCLANGKLLTESRSLITRARRFLNPAWTISGSSDEQPRAPDDLADLCQIVRARFAAGSLFVLPDNKSWTGRGISDICAVCSKPIFAAEVSQELIGARRAHAHLMCYRAWRMESVAFSESGGRPQVVSG